jgi:hypothetical protein
MGAASMKPAGMDELLRQVRQERRAKFIRGLQTQTDESLYIDYTDLQKLGRTHLVDDGQTQQLIAWYVAHGGYVAPGRRYLTAKLSAGVRALWECEVSD